MGATFPLLVRAATTDDASRPAGAVYAANTLGSIGGAFLAGFVLLPNLQVTGTVLLACGVNLAAAALASRRAWAIVPALATAAALWAVPPPWDPMMMTSGVYKYVDNLDEPTMEELQSRFVDRYELLYEAGLVEEARRDGRESALAWSLLPRFGTSMRFDHRRILATAIGRVRAKIKYRPVIFELMPDNFTLYELQKTVEAILGPHLHKQNFRRLVESAGLVEPTGEVKTQTGGRPAKLFRFRREVLLERPAPGVRVKRGRV